MGKPHIKKINDRHLPPGRVKIAEALRSLLAEKEFSAITTSEIAKTAGVTEALIYKYFQDKRDLLHQVLKEYMEDFLSRGQMDLRGIKGALNKLRKLIWSHINMYAANRVFARILLLEVRNYPDYFKSDAYEIVRRYGKMVRQIVKEGIEGGEIRDDISVSVIRQAVLGGIEHVCLPGVIFNRDIEADKLTEELCELIFNGIAQTHSSPDKGSE
ncbi:MAG: TetR/AcrR family transcriptional regulator [Desulfomonile tiedjei]|nr:TetR/AcrR family transcriptional regulator [Desulfomonile tiedjei]